MKNPIAYGTFLDFSVVDKDKNWRSNLSQNREDESQLTFNEI